MVSGVQRVTVRRESVFFHRRRFGGMARAVYGARRCTMLESGHTEGAFPVYESSRFDLLAQSSALGTQNTFGA